MEISSEPAGVAPPNTPAAPTPRPTPPRPASSGAPRPVPTPRPQPVASSAAPPQPVQPAKVENAWAAFFRDWPAEIPRRGIVITQQNEASPFRAFMLRGDFLLLERTTPDSSGGRFLVLSFEEIAVVKFTDPLKQHAFESAGFQGELSS